MSDDLRFDALLTESADTLPPPADVSPWRSVMSCVVWGIALKTLTLQLLYLDYILPTLGCILLVLGFRTLRQENRALRWAYGLSIAAAVLRSAALVLAALPVEEGLTLAYADMALMQATLIALWRGMVGVSRAAGAEKPSAPAAGVLFAFEEMKSRRDTSLIVAACASAIGAHLMIRIVFGMGRILPFAGFEAPPLSSFWIVALEGAVFGVLGVGYNKTLLWLHDREAGQTLIPDRWRALPPLLLAGCLALFAPLLIGGGESLIIFVGEHDVALKTLILLLAFKYLFAQYSTVASIPGGLLMPILCLGALWGRLWAELPVSALAAHGLASGSVQPYVLFGMVSYFAATVRAPLTGIVLVTEMSGTYTCLPGSLLAGLIACKVANLLHCPPVYDSLKERIRL